MIISANTDSASANVVLMSAVGAGLRNGHRGRRLPHTSNLAFPGVEAESLVIALKGATPELREKITELQTQLEQAQRKVEEERKAVQQQLAQSIFDAFTEYKDAIEKGGKLVSPVITTTEEDVPPTEWEQVETICLC